MMKWGGSTYENQAMYCILENHMIISGEADIVIYKIQHPDKNSQ